MYVSRYGTGVAETGRSRQGDIGLAKRATAAQHKESREVRSAGNNNAYTTLTNRCVGWH